MVSCGVSSASTRETRDCACACACGCTLRALTAGDLVEVGLGVGVWAWVWVVGSLSVTLRPSNSEFMMGGCCCCVGDAEEDCWPSTEACVEESEELYPSSVRIFFALSRVVAWTADVCGMNASYLSLKNSA